MQVQPDENKEVFQLNVDKMAAVCETFYEMHHCGPATVQEEELGVVHELQV